MLDSEIVAVRTRAQYDNGVAAGSPPDFDGPTSGARPRPYVEPARALPRLGPVPVLVAGPGITLNAPKGTEGTGEGLPEPDATPRAPSPILAPPRALDGRLVVGGTLALLLLWFLVAGRDDE